MIGNKIYNDIVSNDLDLETRRAMDLQIQTQLSRQLFVRIEVINHKKQIVSEVAGSAISGNYNIDASAMIRRTCSITFNLERGYLPNNSESQFWINKKFKLYIGIRQGNTNNIYWFDKGTYAIKDPNVNISITEQTITVNGLDKMALHNGDISGQLEYATMVDVEDGAYVHDAVREIMKDSGETKLSIAETALQVPYKIESAIGDTRCDVLTKLTELFYNYQAYYDIDGTFVFNTKPAYMSNNTTIHNDIVMDFSELHSYKEKYPEHKLQTVPYDLIMSINRDVAYSNVKNKVVIYGGVHEDGYQPRHTIEVKSDNYPNSPYAIDKLDEEFVRTLVIQDDTYIDAIIDFEQYDETKDNVRDYTRNVCVKYKDGDAEEYIYYLCQTDSVDNKKTPNSDTEHWKKICTETELKNALDNSDANSELLENYLKEIHAYSIDRCVDRAEQEVYLHQQVADTITITCIPIYSLDVNEVIWVDDSKSGVQGEYVINSISCGLGVGDTMSITANKLW